MPDLDLDERLRPLERLEPPDLWGDIRERTPHAHPEANSRGRWTAIGVAVAASAVGITLAARAFLGGTPSARPVEPGPRFNGKIAFLEGSMSPGISDAQIYLVNPDGSGRRRLTTGLHVFPSVSWSPDGSRLAFVQGTGGEGSATNIFVMNADGSGLREITRATGVEQNIEPAWSPDGTRILFSATSSASGRLGPHGLFVMDSWGGNMQRVTACGTRECRQSGGDFFAAWSPDGTAVVFRRLGELWRVDLATRRTEVLCRECSPQSAPVWSPAGDNLAFVRSVGEGEEIATIRSDGSEVRTLRAEPGGHFFGLSWSPDGRFIAYGLNDANGSGQPAGIYLMNADGTRVRMIVEGGSAPGVVLCCPAWQPLVAPPSDSGFTREPVAVGNGEIWFRRGGGEVGLWIESIDPDGSNRQVLFSDTYAGGTNDVGEAYDWSPDGSRVAFIDSTRYIGEVPTGSSWDIYTMNADGTGRRQVTDDGGFDGSPSWSPDGTRIVYASDRGDPNRPACQIDVNCNRDIFVVNTDGTGQRQLTDEPGADWQPDWAADGRILFVSERSDPSGDIFTMSEDGTAVTRLTDTPGVQEFQPRWSPDGGRIAFVRSDGNSNDLVVMNADGSNQTRIAGDLPVSHSVEPDILDDFGWSPDGSMIAFVAGGDRASTLYVIGSDGQGLRALVEEPQYGVGGPAWRPILIGDRGNFDR